MGRAYKLQKTCYHPDIIGESGNHKYDSHILLDHEIHIKKKYDF